MSGIKLSQRLPDLGRLSTWGSEVVLNPDHEALVDKWLADAKEGFRRYTNSAPYSGGRVRMPTDTDEYARLEALLSVLTARYEITHDVAQLRVCYAEIRALALGFRHVNDDDLRSNFRQDLYGSGTDGLVVANAMLVKALRQFIAVAQALGETQDSVLGQRTLTQLLEAFRNRFLSGNGRLVQESQASLTAAILSEALEEAEMYRCRAQLVERIRKSGVDLPPALLRYVLPILSDAGHGELATALLLDADRAGWLIAEGVDVDEFVSPDSLGVMSWVIRQLLHIQVMPQTGEQSVRYNVHFSPKESLRARRFKNLSCRFPLSCGELWLAWRIDGDDFRLDASVPVNCLVNVELPDGFDKQLTSGRHELFLDVSGLELQADAGLVQDGVPTLVDSADS